MANEAEKKRGISEVDNMLEFHHSKKRMTVSINAVVAASPVIRDMLGADLTFNGSHIVEDCKPEQLEAFVNPLRVCTGGDRKLAVTFESLPDSPDVIANALPLIHKYDTTELKELCFATINAHPDVGCIVLYDSLYEGTRWPKDTLAFLISNTMCHHMEVDHMCHHIHAARQWHTLNNTFR